MKAEHTLPDAKAAPQEDVWNSKDRLPAGQVMKNLADVKASLRSLIDESRSGEYGYITPEWGFSTPNGLGARLGGKFKPWEDKLDAMPSFFPSIEAYEYFQGHPFKTKLPDECFTSSEQREKLNGHQGVFDFLMKPPATTINISKGDIKDFRTASKIFMVLANLSHLCGNAAKEPTPLPAWIEDPLLFVAQRLDVEPVLTGHFLTTENWMWNKEVRGRSKKEEMEIVDKLLAKVHVEDRVHFLKKYKQCFVSSQVVDLLVDGGYATSREEAVHVGRKLNKRYHLWEHVSGYHELQDGYLFFRFHKRGDSTESHENEKEILETILSVKVKNHWYRTKIYKQCFVACDVVDLLLATGYADTREGAVQLVHKCNAKHKYQLFEHVTRSHEFSDDYLFFRFKMATGPDEKEISTELVIPVDEDVLEAPEFRIENIDLLYPAFGGHTHEKNYHLLPVCMGYHLCDLPFTVLEVLDTMQLLLNARESNLSKDVFEEHEDRLVDLLYKISFQLSRSKEQFQLISTEPTSRTYLNKHVFIRQMQPLAKGVLVRRETSGEPLPSNGMSGLHFTYFHLLDWVLGRYHSGKLGLMAKMAEVDKYYPKLQREYIQRLSKLNKSSTMRGVVDALGRPPKIMAAFNHLIECYAGEGGVLTAHCRKLYSYLHNNLQIDTAAEGSVSGTKVLPTRKTNSETATLMYHILMAATKERERLRVAPLMVEAEKHVYSTSESGGFATVSLSTTENGLRYEYGDVARVLLSSDTRTSMAWMHSLQCIARGDTLKCEDMVGGGKGWEWSDLWEVLGWNADGVSLEQVSRYIERAKVTDDSGETRWINTPFDLIGDGASFFDAPPEIRKDQLLSLVPVSPRIYSVCGAEADRVFLMVSRPMDNDKHHGYERIADPQSTRAHLSFSPATHFLIPPVEVTNLVCVASGTGIAPFVGLAAAIGGRSGSYTITHQCKSADLFLANSETWLEFTRVNPGAVVFGFISGDGSMRNNPMTYTIWNGEFSETRLLSEFDDGAYYWSCPTFVKRLEQVYKPEGLNLGYCCGGVRSCIHPLQNIIKANDWKYELTVESYNVTSKPAKKSHTCVVGGSVVDLKAVSVVHDGGDQILDQMQKLAWEKKAEQDDKSKQPLPDHSSIFWSLHPHSYNLHRCLRSSIEADADYVAFEAFVKALNRRNSTVVSKRRTRNDAVDLRK